MREVLINEQNELKKITPEKEIIEAIESKNSKQLFSVLVKINEELTDLEAGDFSPDAGVENFKKSIEFF